MRRQRQLVAALVRGPDEDNPPVEASHRGPRQRGDVALAAPRRGAAPAHVATMSASSIRKSAEGRLISRSHSAAGSVTDSGVLATTTRRTRTRLLYRASVVRRWVTGAGARRGWSRARGPGRRAGRSSSALAAPSTGAAAEAHEHGVVAHAGDACLRGARHDADGQLAARQPMNRQIHVDLRWLQQLSRTWRQPCEETRSSAGGASGAAVACGVSACLGGGAAAPCRRGAGVLLLDEGEGALQRLHQPLDAFLHFAALGPHPLDLALHVLDAAPATSATIRSARDLGVLITRSPRPSPDP